VRWLRRLAKFLAVAVILVAAVLGGFRVTSMMRETQTPEAAAGPRAFFVKADGLKMHYKTWGPTNGRPLVLVHGTVSWAGTWADVALPLAAQGYRVIAPDMPPFGFSEKAPDGDYMRPASAKRLAAFVDALGLETFTLGVHSYGGGLALEFAFANPAKIDGLILFDVALGLQRAAPPAPPLAALLNVEPIRNAIMSTTFANPMMIGYGLRQFVYDDSLIDDARIAVYAKPRYAQGTTEAVGHWFMNGLFGDPAGTRSDDVANYKAFQAPVLVIWGEEDKTTPLEQGRFIAKAFPNAQLEILPEVDHIPQIENPALVVRLIERFLKELPARSAKADADPIPTAATPLPLRGALD
jgi:pimeloyl-ACP methyl ester carboxylesterase